MGSVSTQEWSGLIPGFGVRTYKHSSSYIFRDKISGRTITIGRTSRMSLAEAREEVMRRYAPQLEYGRITFKDAAEIWLSAYALKNKRSVKEDIRRLHKRLYPTIGHLRLSDIKTGHMLELHREISITGPVEANRVLALVSAIYGKMQAWDYYDGKNPARGVDKAKEVPRTEVIRGEEITRLTRVLGAHELGELFMLCLTCGLRPTEAKRARWEDFRAGHLTVLKNKRGRSHTVIPPAWLTESLESRRKASGWIFPSPRTGSHWKDVRGPWRLVLRDAGLPQNLQVRDLRRSFITAVIDNGGTLLQASKAADHTSTAVTERVYAQVKASEAKKAFKIIEEAFRI